jgi:hypothetical protein
MGDDNATIGSRRPKNVGKHACDVFIGKTVKPVAPDTLRGESARQRERSNDFGLGSRVIYDRSWRKAAIANIGCVRWATCYKIEMISRF